MPAIPDHRLRSVRALLALAAAAALCACSPDAVRNVEMHQPLTARPVPYVGAAPTQGAIFQLASTSRGVYQPLFEDRRARAVGDTLTISINEKINASKTATSDANRKGDMAFTVPDAQIAGKSIKGGSLTAQSKSDFAGGGDSSANNVFTGTIAVTVIDVLPNGNLLVAGEKQIGINQGSEFIRLSGIVNPQHIGYGNVVSSTEVAEARLEYRGSGYINEAQTMGWLARVFQSVMPF